MWSSISIGWFYIYWKTSPNYTSSYGCEVRLMTPCAWHHNMRHSHDDITCCKLINNATGQPQSDTKTAWSTTWFYWNTTLPPHMKERFSDWLLLSDSLRPCISGLRVMENVLEMSSKRSSAVENDLGLLFILGPYTGSWVKTVYIYTYMNTHMPCVHYTSLDLMYLSGVLQHTLI